MKKLLSVLTLFTVILVASCTKENRAKRLISHQDEKWAVTQFFRKEYKESSPGSNDFNMYYDFSYTDCGYAYFHSNSDARMRLEWNGISFIYKGTWSNTDSEIIFVEENQTKIYQIKELNRKEMTLVYRYDYTQDGTRYYTEYTYEFEKNEKYDL